MTLFVTRAIIAAWAVAAAGTCALAQTRAERPVRIVVGADPEGASDTQIRLLLPVMTKALGKGFIIDNRPGGGGVMAAALAAKAAPDGQTLLLGNSRTHAVHAAINSRLGYDPVRDFTAISQLSSSGLVVAAHPRLPGRSISDFVPYAKSVTGKLRVGILDVNGELAGNALWLRLGVSVTNIRHKDDTFATRSLVLGEVDLSLLKPYEARPHVHAGRLKAYGITGDDRSPILPEVPTMIEQGLTGYEFPFWNGLFAPAKTPREIVDAVYRSAAQALKTAPVRTGYGQLGYTTIGSSPTEFASAIRRDIERLRRLAVETGMRRS